MMKAVLIDDDPNALNTLRMLLNACVPEVSVCGEANSVPQGIERIAHYHPDLIFLDIDLGEISGFEVLDAFPAPDFSVIIVTAHSDFAVKAFRYNVLDYLLKPLNPDELTTALLRVPARRSAAFYSEQIDNLRDNYRTRHCERLAFPSVEGHFFVKVDEIEHIKSEGNYCYVSLTNGEIHFAARSIKEFEEMLPATRFIRTHQSHIVNLNCIRKAAKINGLSLQLSNGSVAPVSRRRQGEVTEKLEIGNWK